MQQVRRLQIRTRRQVSDVLSGAYLSVFKGSGVEFDEVRPYVPGDDVRSIDWNVTARTGVPYIKRFVEERELSIMLLVDVSASMDTGSIRSKRATSAELGALLSFSAIANQDKVGLMLFSDKDHLFIPPRKGQKHGLRIVRELLSPQFDQPILKKDLTWFKRWSSWLFSREKKHDRQTDLQSAFEFCQQVLKRRSVIFVITDCQDQDFWSALQSLNSRHDVVLAYILDPMEAELPFDGLISVQDIESGKEQWLDAGDEEWKNFQNQTQKHFFQQLENQANRSGIDHIVLRTDQEAIDPLMEFMRRRERRGR